MLRIQSPEVDENFLAEWITIIVDHGCNNSGDHYSNNTSYNYDHCNDYDVQSSTGMNRDMAWEIYLNMESSWDL